MTLPWIRVDGTDLVNEHGEVVRLYGVGLGGWMNMENFITGYPGNEENLHRLLRDRMGNEAYDAFLESFYEGFFAEADAAHLASLGLNSVRIPVNYRHFEDDARPFELKEEGFARLDRAVSLLARHGLYSVIDLHAAPGRQNQHWHSDNPTHLAEFWRHRHFQDRAVHLWEALAERYRDRPEVAGYNLLNEPAEESGQVLLAFYERAAAAVRAIDPRHTLFLDGNRYSTDFSVFEQAGPLPNTVYTAHDYALPGLESGTGYPGTTRGEYFDRDVVEQTFLRRTEFMRRTGTPIWIGEFGPQYSRDRSQDPWRLQLLRDQLEIYRDHGASWSLWTYKDIGLQGLVHAREDSDYLRLIAPVLETKRRLGVDSWGGNDRGVRQVLEPIEEIFDAEFPDFSPYPWGRRPYIATLVRHILLAEPLAERFADLLAGTTPQQARRLAGAFRFEETEERTGLSQVLREHTGAG